MTSASARVAPESTYEPLDHAISQLVAAKDTWGRTELGARIDVLRAVKAATMTVAEDWTQAQAELLRQGRLSEADIANILEEIDSLGRTQVAELRSRLRVLAHHLLKEIYQPEKASRSWATTIVIQRQDLERHMRDNPSLKPRTTEIFAQAYADARKVVATETGIPLKTFPKDSPFTYAQATDDSFWPGRSVDDRA